MQIPKLIKQLQERRGETNAAFARALGIKSSYLAQLLQRKTSVEVANKYLAPVGAEIEVVLWQTITDDPATRPPKPALRPPKPALLIIRAPDGSLMISSAPDPVMSRGLVKGAKWSILN